MESHKQLSPLVINMYKGLCDFLNIESNFQGCIGWKGPHRILKTTPGIPLLVCNLEAYYASLIGYAIENSTDYPFSWFRMNCGNLWCVNGNHVTINSSGRTGRKTLELHETNRYQEKYELIKAHLESDPNLLSAEILNRLRIAGLGGNQRVLLAIVGKARKDLGLRARMPTRRTLEKV